MRQTKALLCLAFLVLSGVAFAEDSDDEYEDSDSYRATLIVHKAIVDNAKTLTYPLIVQGRNATVVVTLTNVGSGPAEDVVLTDVLPSNAKLLEGSVTASFGKIASGSAVKHTYSLIFTGGGSLDITYLPLASVSYKAADDTYQKGFSSKAGAFVVTPVQQISRYALMAGTYASLGICRTPYDWRNMGLFLGVIGAILGANYSYKAFGAHSTTTKRKKALKELEKNE